MPLSRIGTNSITDYAIGATDLANNSIETYTSNAGRPLTNRNLIINGAMQVAQRNTSVTGITTTGYYTADRWNIQLSSAGTWTMNVESSAPTGTEFRNSANLICTTADSSLSAGDFILFNYRFEGQNLQGIKKGTGNAESLTLSFYVKSSNTGTYICDFFDIDNFRQISKSYTINAANTWEKKTITVPPDTTGQFVNDNGEGLRLHFWLATGTTYSSGTLNSSAWASTVQANRAVGQLNLANLSGNYFAITGVQLETGTVATPFELRNIGDELALCQRYYFNDFIRCQGAFYSSTQIVGTNRLPVTMRASPAVSLTTGTTIDTDTVGGSPSTVTPTFDYITPNSLRYSGTNGLSASIGHPVNIMSSNIQASAEL